MIGDEGHCFVFLRHSIRYFLQDRLNHCGKPIGRLVVGRAMMPHPVNRERRHVNRGWFYGKTEQSRLFACEPSRDGCDETGLGDQGKCRHKQRYAGDDPALTADFGQSLIDETGKPALKRNQNMILGKKSFEIKGFMA